MEAKLLWLAFKAFLSGIIAFAKEIARRQVDTDSGAADQRAADAAAETEAEKKAQAKSDEIDTLSDDELRARAERVRRTPS